MNRHRFALPLVAALFGLNAEAAVDCLPKKPADQDHLVFQYTLDGWGYYSAHGIAYRLQPGTAFTAIIPSEHSYSMPAAPPTKNTSRGAQAPCRRSSSQPNRKIAPRATIS